MIEDFEGSSLDMRVLAKPKYGTSNLINDRLYAEIKGNSNVEVISWTTFANGG